MLHRQVSESTPALFTSTRRSSGNAKVAGSVTSIRATVSRPSVPAAVGASPTPSAGFRMVATVSNPRLANSTATARPMPPAGPGDQCAASDVHLDLHPCRIPEGTARLAPERGRVIRRCGSSRRPGGPTGVVGHLPDVAVGIGERTGGAAPFGDAGRPDDGAAGPLASASTRRPPPASGHCGPVRSRGLHGPPSWSTGRRPSRPPGRSRPRHRAARPRASRGARRRRALGPGR